MVALLPRHVAKRRQEKGAAESLPLKKRRRAIRQKHTHTLQEQLKITPLPLDLPAQKSQVRALRSEVGGLASQSHPSGADGRVAEGVGRKGDIGGV